MMIAAEKAFGNQWTPMPANCTKRRLSGRRYSWKYKTYRTALDKNPHYDVYDLELPPCRSEPPPLKGFSVPQGITLKELGIIKTTAQFVARYGTGQFWIVLAQEVIDKPLFSFLKTTDNRYRFYYGLVAAYQRVLKPRLVLREEEGTFIDDFYHCLQMDKLLDDGGDDDDEKLDIDIDLHAFVGGLDFFTHMDVLDDPQVTIMPPPQPVSAMHPLRCREPLVADDAEADLEFSVKLTLKELGTMKLTAQFVARYGLCFRLALMMRELRNPTFGFMFSPKDQFNSRDPAAARFHIFSKLVVAYSNVLIPSNKFDDSPATLVAAFFLRLQLEKLEQGVAETTTEEAMLDLHAFVSGSVDYFAHMDDDYYSLFMAPPERLSVTMNRPTHSTVLVRFSLGLRVSCSTWFVLKGAVPPWITPEELVITKLTAQFTERFGTCFKRALMSRLSTEPRLDFMRFDEIKKSALRQFRVVYSAVLKPSRKATEGDDDCTAMALDLFFHCLQLEGVVDTTTAVIQLGAFMSGVDYLAYMYKDLDYYDRLPLPQRLSVMMSQVPLPPVGERKPTRIRPLLSLPSTCLRQDLTPKELVVIKLTALFAARYGMVFCRDLLKKVALKPEYKLLFMFMEPSDTWFELYSVVVLAYSKVVKERAYTEETVLENFFTFLEWEEGGETAMLDLYAFVEGVDCFAQMEDDNYSALMGNHLARNTNNYAWNVLSSTTAKETKVV